jgi:hypothetical protein
MGTSPTQGRYLHRTAQYRKIKKKIHAVIGTRTHDLSVQAVKAYSSDGVATGTGVLNTVKCIFPLKSRDKIDLFVAGLHPHVCVATSKLLYFLVYFIRALSCVILHLYAKPRCNYAFITKCIR